jgi:hypothetical protein
MIYNASFEHDPSSVLDYGFDWLSGGWLATGETIISSTWAESTGVLTLASQQIVNGVTSLFIGGGIAGKLYYIVNHITTSAGRQDQRTILLYCKKR